MRSSIIDGLLQRLHWKLLNNRPNRPVHLGGAKDAARRVQRDRLAARGLSNITTKPWNVQSKRSSSRLVTAAPERFRTSA